MRPDHTAILGLGTSLPPHRCAQSELERFSANVLDRATPSPARDRALRLIGRIYSRSGVETRHTLLPDYRKEDPAEFEFYPPTWDLEPFPDTAQRMAAFETASVDIADVACRRALVEAGAAATDVTHLVVCTCTGVFAPGPDVWLVDRLGIRRGVKRTMVAFMGCYAGFNGMRVADDIVRNEPTAVVLQVCIELCSLHFQKRPVDDFVVANCLFADGCAAAVFGASSRPRTGSLGRTNIMALLSHIGNDSRELMTWRVGATGFELQLSEQVPASLAMEAPGFVSALLDHAATDRARVRAWALHPGGWRVVAALAEALGLREADTAPSLDILRSHGNMSSATIFFVLESLLANDPPDGPIVALGFGPGLTIEGAVLGPCS